MVKRGSATSTKRGRKQNPISSATGERQTNGTSPLPLHVTSKETVPQKNSFRGKLSHTSPVLDLSSREKKITVYFPALKLDDDAPDTGDKIGTTNEAVKSLALHRVFARVKCSPEKTAEGPSPHKIVLNAKEEAEELEKEVVEEAVKIPDNQDEPPPVAAGTEEATAAATATGDAAKEPKVKTTKTKRKLIVSQSVNQDVSQNHKLTEYFAVRRSVRKPKTAILEEKQRHLEEVVQSGVEDGLQIHNFPGKGRGIVATRLFRRGEFVVEYSGDLIDMAEAREREKIYAADQNTGCYMYYFQYKNQSYCVDATAESPRLGRLVNHSRTAGNLSPKIIEIKDRPHLLLVARCDILPGEELLYDYGDRSRVSLKHHPWLAT